MQRVRHANRDAYSSGHLVLSHFGTCMCSNVETNLSWTCLVSGLLNFEHPSVLLFCLVLIADNNCWYDVKWHSDPWPTVTSKPIRLSTNFMTLIPSLTFAEYGWFPWSICNGCGMQAGNAYPSGHLVPSPNCGTCLCSNCWDQVPRTCHVFTRLFTSNTPWYFLDFALRKIMSSI